MKRGPILICTAMILAGCMTPQWRRTAIRESEDRLARVETYFIVDVRWESPGREAAWIRPDQEVATPIGVEYRTAGRHGFKADLVREPKGPFPITEVVNIIKKDRKDKREPCDCPSVPYAVVAMFDARGEYAGLIVLNSHSDFYFMWPPDEDAHYYGFFPSPKSLALPEAKEERKDR